MNKLALTALAALTLAAAFSGCLENKQTAYHAYGSKGSYAAGFAYDGKGIVPFDGPAFLDVNDVDNKGSFVARGKVGGISLEVLFEEFAQSRPFHDGGIAADFLEHGNSGVGDKSIPEVDLEMAAWGKATVMYGDKLMKDPISDKDQWTAHFMVIRNGVRDNETGAIWADQAKTVAYSPTAPDNGTGVLGDYELHLVLRNQTANGSDGPKPVGPISCCQTSAGPFTGNHNLFTADALGATAKVEIQLQNTGLTAANLTFELRKPSGTAITRQSLGAAAVEPSSGPRRFSIEFPVDELGQYTVAVTGRMAPGATYTIGGEVTPPAAVVLNLWWEDLLFGLEAEQRAEAEGLLEGTSAHMDDGHAHSSMTMPPLVQ